ncbi:MAG: hypothetical protein LBB38_02860 [Puniceicoccales bacterium]|jgi:hypothetical protein|nr:hypothetical protein [Puniceicoccales bacterium]
MNMSGADIHIAANQASGVSVTGQSSSRRSPLLCRTAAVFYSLLFIPIVVIALLLDIVTLFRLGATKGFCGIFLQLWHGDRTAAAPKPTPIVPPPTIEYEDVENLRNGTLKLAENDQELTESQIDVNGVKYTIYTLDLIKSATEHDDSGELEPTSTFVNFTVVCGGEDEANLREALGNINSIKSIELNSNETTYIHVSKAHILTYTASDGTTKTVNLWIDQAPKEISAMYACLGNKIVRGSVVDIPSSDRTGRTFSATIKQNNGMRAQMVISAKNSCDGDTLERILLSVAGGRTIDGCRLIEVDDTSDYSESYEITLGGKVTYATIHFPEYADITAPANFADIVGTTTDTGCTVKECEIVNLHNYAEKNTLVFRVTFKSSGSSGADVVALMCNRYHDDYATLPKVLGANRIVSIRQTESDACIDKGWIAFTISYYKDGDSDPEQPSEVGVWMYCGYDKPTVDDLLDGSRFVPRELRVLDDAQERNGGDMFNLAVISVEDESTHLRHELNVATIKDDKSSCANRFQEFVGSENLVITSLELANGDDQIDDQIEFDLTNDENGVVTTMVYEKCIIHYTRNGGPEELEAFLWHHNLDPEPQQDENDASGDQQNENDAADDA